MALTDKYISVVIPCYNEAKNIRELYERLSKTLQSLTGHYEIIFVDNQSTDESAKIYENIAKHDTRVSVIFFSRNFGSSQYGYSAGTQYASGDAVIWLEGDLQDPPEVIAELVKKWLEGYDVVYGVRPKAVGSAFSRFSRRTFYKLFRKMSYLDIPKDAGDFSLLDRKVANVFNDMPERSRFVRGLRAWAGFRHTGVTYTRSERKAGKSSNSFRSNIWWAKKFIFSFSYAPLEFISKVSIRILFLVIAISFFLFLWALSGAITWIQFIITVCILWMLAIIMIELAILSETISIIFEEVKQRPKFIIQKIINDHRS